MKLNYFIFYLTVLSTLMFSCGDSSERVAEEIPWGKVLDSSSTKTLGVDSLKNQKTLDTVMHLTLDSALKGSTAPKEILDRMTLLEVRYWGFDSTEKTGYLVLDADLAKETKEIFDSLLKMKYPIEKITPISFYGWNDDSSMTANNTSGFNYRTTPGLKKLSDHGFGRAIDINPRYNPYFFNGDTLPKNGIYDTSRVETLHSKHPVVSLFRKKGWVWGGNWAKNKDYQHFSKKIEKKQKSVGYLEEKTE